MYIYIYIYICMYVCLYIYYVYTNLPVNAIVRLPHPGGGSRKAGSRGGVHPNFPPKNIPALGIRVNVKIAFHCFHQLLEIQKYLQLIPKVLKILLLSFS